MSKPGDKGRPTIVITGRTPDVLVELVGLAQRMTAAESFELAYDCPDRVLAEEEEPRPDERVRWRANLVVRRKARGRKSSTHTYTGEAIVDPGQDHGTRGGVAATIALLEKIGANVIVVDTPQDPNTSN